MRNEEINEMVLAYQEAGDEEIFSDLFEKLKPRLIYRVRKETEENGFDQDDVWSAIHVALTLAIKSFDVAKGNFLNLFYKILRNELKDLKRDTYKYKREIPGLEIKDDDDNPPIYFYDPLQETPEEIVVSKIQRKIEQRQLLYALKTGERICDDILTHFHEFDTITALGKAFGYHHQQLRRCLNRMCKNYDQQHFGRIEDYFTA